LSEAATLHPKYEFLKRHLTRREFILCNPRSENNVFLNYNERKKRFERSTNTRGSAITQQSAVVRAGIEMDDSTGRSHPLRIRPSCIKGRIRNTMHQNL